MPNTQPVFYIPPGTKLVVVSDLFAEDYVGGAELTLEAILAKCPVKYFKLHSGRVTPELVEAGKDCHWLLVNYSGMSKDSVVSVATACRYSIIECDYKYCVFRSSHLHKLQTGNDCDCHTTDPGRFVQGLFKRADVVHFMSDGQRQEYFRLFPKMATWPEGKMRVQGSTFSDQTLNSLQTLHRTRGKQQDTWAVMSGGTWIKNQEATEQYCKDKGLKYDLVGGLKPEEFLQKLALHKGLVFHPLGFDTAPRLTMEAKVIGLDLDLNDNVQHKDEPWFAGGRENCYSSLEDRAERFWNHVTL